MALLQPIAFRSDPAGEAVAEHRDISRSLRYASRAILLVAAVAFIAFLPAAPSLPRRYLLEQDVPLLIIASIGLGVLARIRNDDTSTTAPSARVRWMTMLAAVAFAYFGAHFLLGSYPVSRDEVLADFQAKTLYGGHLGWPIPHDMADIAQAAMPLWSDSFISRGYWVGNYLPINSAFRAIGIALGDIRITSPLLLLLGAASLWSAARRIWPTTPHAAWVAVVLAITSTQVLTTAMTPYAMTAHFALNALWLACFLRGGRIGHGTALAIGLAASGLHQVQFHLIFISGIVIWLWKSRQRRLALVYGAACIGYWFVWNDLYPHLLAMVMGPPPNLTLAPATTYAVLLDKFSRLKEITPFTSIIRFVAWENVLLAPLFVIGLRATKNAEGLPTILWGLAVSCLIGLAATVYQGHGYGYRYLHSLIPAFCIVAAGGWIRIEQESGRSLPIRLLGGSVAIALLATLPFAVWRAETFVAPYRAAYEAVRNAPADIVLVDGRAGAFLQDIVRLDDATPHPLLLDLAYVPASRIDQWCSGGMRIMLFGWPEAKTLGVMKPYYPGAHDDDAAARWKQLAEHGCGVRMSNFKQI